MARRFFQIAAGAALIHLGLLFPALCHAQSPAPQASASPSAPDDIKGGKHGRTFSRENLSPDQQKKYDSLPPEQQQKMQENWERWQNMTPEERKEMRDNEKLRHEKVLQEIEEALKESGLQLDDKTRDEYVMRYTEERRRIEQKLQMEMQEKRGPLVQDLIARLKAEFQSKSSPSPAASSPSPSPAPASSPSK